MKADRFRDADPVIRAHYNAKDTWQQRHLGQIVQNRLNDVHRGQELYDRYLALGHVAMRMRRVGIGVARDHVEPERKRLELIRNEATIRLAALASSAGFQGDFNHNSHRHRMKLFGEHLGAKIPFDAKTGAPTLNKKALEEICVLGEHVAAPARTLLQLRRAEKFLETYIEPIGNRDRVHSTWRPEATVTGRWADSDGLTRLPKDRWGKDKLTGKKVLVSKGLRDLYGAAPGKYLVERDFSQLESRILALISGDRQLLDWHNAGIDVHTVTAAILFEIEAAAGSSHQRELAKRFRYAFHYGSRPETAWAALVVEFPTLPLTAVIKAFKQLARIHSGIARYHTSALKCARENDYVEDPLSGRRFWFHGQVEPAKVFNLPIQMAASAIINPAMLRIMERLQPGEEIVAQVHDSLVAEGPDPVRLDAILVEELERPIELNGNRSVFRTDGKVGVNWGELKDVHVPPLAVLGV